MRGFVKGFDFMNMEMQRYWSFPSSYTQSKKKETLSTMLYSGDYVASLKVDGYAELFIKDDEGVLTMRARNKGVNGWVCKEEWVPHLHPFFDELPNGTVLVGEVYLPGRTSKDITSILGCGVKKAIERQQGGNPLQLSVFDILAWDGALTYSWPISQRIEYLEKVRPFTGHHPDVSVVEYWFEPDEIHEKWLQIIASGGEGVVLTHKDYPYSFGQRSARKTLKLKKELEDELLVFFTGKWKAPEKEYKGKYLETHEYWYDEVKQEKINRTLAEIVDLSGLTPITKAFYHGWAGSLEIGIIKDGHIVPLGYLSGLTEQVKAEVVTDNLKYKNRPCDIQAMEVDTSGSTPTLRHAKFLWFRDDVSYKEATWEKAFGGK